MSLVINAVVIGAIILVNTRYHGGFFVGLLVIVLPFLVLSYVLPRVLPVLCPRCRARMRFRLSQIDDRRQLFAYVCDRCKTGHEWEGASSGSTLGD
jgi:hypothetical protein